MEASDEALCHELPYGQFIAVGTFRSNRRGQISANGAVPRPAEILTDVLYLQVEGTANSATFTGMFAHLQLQLRRKKDQKLCCLKRHRKCLP